MDFKIKDQDYKVFNFIFKQLKNKGYETTNWKI